MTDPVGWYVRVGGLPVWDGVYDTALYVAGHGTPAEAEAAVRAVCLAADSRIDVLPDPIWPGRGPQPAPGEVRLIPGAA